MAKLKDALQGMLPNCLTDIGCIFLLVGVPVTGPDSSFTTTPVVGDLPPRLRSVARGALRSRPPGPAHRPRLTGVGRCCIGALLFLARRFSF